MSTIELEILDEAQNVVLTMCRADVDRILGDAEGARREFGFRRGDIIALLETTYEVAITRECEYRYGFEGQVREVGRRKATSHRVAERYAMRLVQGQWLWQEVS